MALFGEVGINSLRAIENRHKINYLKRYMILDKEINRLLDDVEYQRSKLGRLTSSISETPRGGGSIYHDVNLEAINTIVNLEQQINHKIDQAIIYRQEIEAVIEKVEDDTERLLLSYRYINGELFETIAVKLNYSWRHVHRIHSNALQKIEI